MISFSLITYLTAMPLVGGLLLLLLGPVSRSMARFVALATSVITLIAAVSLWIHFDPTAIGMQFGETHDWITNPDGQLLIQYRVGVDGVGLLMVLLTAILTPIALWASARIEYKASMYYALMLFLQAGLFGTFTALNFFHWFLFWELSLIPAFFLIKLWGGPERSAAATQFFIYTMVGSVAMLLSFLAIQHAVHTFDFLKLRDLGGSGQLSAALASTYGGWLGLSGHRVVMLIFAGVFLGFAVKVPVFPFHTWLPATYAEAPTGTTMMLTGAMSKMGVYGFLRLLLPLFPEEMRTVLTPLLWLAVATIVCSACASFAQRDLKRLLAYSSINHLGYCLLGVFAFVKFSESGVAAGERAAALNGVLLQMFNHGLTAPILFCFVSFLEQRSGGSRNLNEFGGLRKVAPVFCGLMGIAVFASLGLPGLNGFVGEFLIFKGSFALATWATALSVIGLLVTAIFLLTLIQRVFNGPLNTKWSSLADLSLNERLLVLPATVLMFLIGLCPQLLIGKINETVVQMVDALKF